MALGKADEGYVLYNSYKGTPFLAKSLLNKLLFIVFESIRIKSKECYNQIFESFQKSLQRDPEFDKLLKKIGSLYLGIEYCSGFNIMNMMESFLK